MFAQQYTTMNRLKLLFSCIAILTAFRSTAQPQPDTSRLVQFPTGDAQLLTNTELMIIDSLLVIAVDHYNSKINTGDMTFELEPADMERFLYYDSIRRIYLPYLNRKAKPDRRKLKALSDVEKEVVEALIQRKAYYDSCYAVYDYKAHSLNYRHDSIVSHWGDEGFIDLSDYYRQYTIRSLNNGTKGVTVSCFCSETLEQLERGKINWRRQFITSPHGGSCFFEAMIYLEQNSSVRFMRVHD